MKIMKEVTKNDVAFIESARMSIAVSSTKRSSSREDVYKKY